MSADAAAAAKTALAALTDERARKAAGWALCVPFRGVEPLGIQNPSAPPGRLPL